MKLITLDNLKTFLDKLLEQISTDVYTKQEVDEKLKTIPKNVYTKEETDNRYQRKGESSGGSDYAELARHIPSWQWKVTMPRTVNQTVTATIGSQTYTSDFYAQQGSHVTFSVKANDGFKAGTLSLESATLTEDVAVTITDATWEYVLDAKALFEATSEEQKAMKQVTIPAFANVLEIYGYDKTGAKVHSMYFKPKSHSESYIFKTTGHEVSGENGEKVYLLGLKRGHRIRDAIIESPVLGMGGQLSFTPMPDSRQFTKLVVAWSPEIGAQTPDVEF